MDGSSPRMPGSVWLAGSCRSIETFWTVAAAVPLLPGVSAAVAAPLACARQVAVIVRLHREAVAPKSRPMIGHDEPLAVQRRGALFATGLGAVSGAYAEAILKLDKPVTMVRRWTLCTRPPVLRTFAFARPLPEGRGCGFAVSGSVGRSPASQCPLCARPFGAAGARALTFGGLATGSGTGFRAQADARASACRKTRLDRPGWTGAVGIPPMTRTAMPAVCFSRLLRSPDVRHFWFS
jgi:hypothetical protein